MAFEREPQRTPTAIGNLVVILKDGVAREEEPAYKSAHFEIRVVMSDGTEVVKRGDLIPHITLQQRTGLIDFLNDLRAQAQNEILPIP